MQISKIILWPTKLELGYRTINFQLGKVNYIVGDSNTGKSSIWPIIDYCLGSSKLRVPLGVVRDKVSWYGIVIKKDNNNILLARKNNTICNAKSEWIFDKNNNPIPYLPSKNISSIDDIKDFLSSELNFFLSELSKEIIQELESYNLGNYSFRDILTLNHQAQYALVNPSSIFVKQINDISIAKLKKLLPLALYKKPQAQYNIKKSEKRKIFYEGSTLRKEVDHLENRMKSLYKMANQYKMISSYIEPKGWPIERLANELKYILSRNYELLEFNLKLKNSLSQEIIKKILLLGRIEECLEFSGIIEKIKTLRYKYLLIDSELKSINHHRKSNEHENSVELSELIHLYAYQMQLEFLDFVPYFDERDSTIKFINGDSNTISLSDFGSIRNYVGYNISVFLAFHEVLRKNKKSFVHPFLLIDHPSQGFSLVKDNEDNIKLQALAESLDTAIERMHGDFQLIVMDRIAGNYIKNLPNSNIIEVWDNHSNKSLIPSNW